MAKIKFLNLQVTDVKLKVDTFDQYSTDEIESGPFNIDCQFSETESKLFGISFEINLKNKNQDFELRVKAIAHFECDENINQEFMQSDFVFINAPAIAFPYLRAFISNITLNSGYNPVILPAFNFVAMANAIKDRSKSSSTNEPVTDKKLESRQNS